MVELARVGRVVQARMFDFTQCVSVLHASAANCGRFLGEISLGRHEATGDWSGRGITALRWHATRITLCRGRLEPTNSSPESSSWALPTDTSQSRPRRPYVARALVCDIFELLIQMVAVAPRAKQPKSLALCIIGVSEPPSDLRPRPINGRPIPSLVV